MLKFLSSIFSFETPQFRRIDGRGSLTAIVVALALIAVAETGARVAIGPTGNHWEYWSRGAADKFVWYRQLAIEDETPEIVFAGDSTAARGFLPRTAKEHVPDAVTAFNLAASGNFTRAFEQSTVPLLRPPYAPPKVLVVAFGSPQFVGESGKFQSEEIILSCAYCRRAQDKFVLGDHLFLSRIQHATSFWRSWFSGTGLGQQPRDGGADLAKGQQAVTAARRTPRPADDSEAGTKSFSEKRFKTILDLVKLAQERGFKLVVVIPPTLLPSERQLEVESEYLRRLREIKAEDVLAVVDGRLTPGLAEEHFFNSGHLNGTGAPIFTKYVFEQIETFLPYP